MSAALMSLLQMSSNIPPYGSSEKSAESGGSKRTRLNLAEEEVPIRGRQFVDGGLVDTSVLSSMGIRGGPIQPSVITGFGMVPPSPHGYYYSNIPFNPTITQPSMLMLHQPSMYPAPLPSPQDHLGLANASIMSDGNARMQPPLRLLVDTSAYPIQTGAGAFNRTLNYMGQVSRSLAVDEDVPDSPERRPSSSSSANKAAAQKVDRKKEKVSTKRININDLVTVVEEKVLKVMKRKEKFADKVTVLECTATFLHEKYGLPDPAGFDYDSDSSSQGSEKLDLSDPSLDRNRKKTLRERLRRRSMNRKISILRKMLDVDVSKDKKAVLNAVIEFLHNKPGGGST